jgi:tRNA uridine 5-carboxymethylaminomethyl modification enzyme
MPRAREIGLLDDETWIRFEKKVGEIDRTVRWCEETTVTPDEETSARFQALGWAPPKNKVSAAALLRRPEIALADLSAILSVPDVDAEVAEQVETDLKYEGYLEREEARAERTRKMTQVALPPDLDFALPGLSHEVSERLRRARPATLGAAARLPGITPAAVDLLALHLARRQ